MASAVKFGKGVLRTHLSDGEVPGLAVQETADDAAQSKASMVALGYFEDPFIRFFVRKHKRRSPLINRGYFVRVACVQETITRFLAAAGGASGGAQVVNLGAGVDSTFWRLALVGAHPRLFVELDLPEVTRRKALTVRSTPALLRGVATPAGSPTRPVPDSAAATFGATVPAADASSLALPEGVAIEDMGDGGARVRGPAYSLAPCDLADVYAVSAALKAAGFDPENPALFVSECVMVYMEPSDSAPLLRWIGATCKRAGFVLYEQIRPHDAFGRMMAKNLAERGIGLKSYEAYPTLEAQTARFLAMGFEACSAVDMNAATAALVPPERLRAVSRVEMFDEFEEWTMMEGHYCLVTAVSDRARKSDAMASSSTDASTFTEAEVTTAATEAEAATAATETQELVLPNGVAQGAGPLYAMLVPGGAVPLGASISLPP